MRKKSLFGCVKAKSDVDTAVNQELKDLWVRHLHYGVIAQIILCLILYYFLSHSNMIVFYSSWLILMLVVSTVMLVGLMVYRSYSRYQKKKIFLCLFVPSIILSGIGWGILGFESVLANNLNNLSFIAMALIAVSAGAVAFLSPVFYTYILFFIPLILPFQLQLILSMKGYSHWYYVLILYSSVVLLSAYFMFQTLKKAIHSRLKSEAQSLRISSQHRKSSLCMPQSNQDTADLANALLTSSTAGIIVINNEGKILKFNYSFLNIFNLKNKNLAQDHRAYFYSILKEQISDANDFKYLIKQIRQAPEKPFCGEMILKSGLTLAYYITPYKIKEDILGNIWNFTDITQLKQLKKKMVHQNNHDFLTGLPNRRHMKYKLKELIFQANKNDASVVLLFINIDNFKSINDAFGHEMGDYILQSISNRINQQKRDKDVLIRYGGDEFVLFYPTNRLKNITKLVERIQKSIHEPMYIMNYTFNITASIGVSCYPQDSKNDVELVKHANIALRLCKRSTTNSMKLYEIDFEKEPKIYWETQTELKHAIKHNELFLQYQPIVDLKTGEITSSEALIRWRHPEKGIIMPDKFITIAERSGLIHELGAWTLEQGFRQAKQWHDKNLNPYISLNLSPLQLKDATFIQTLEALIDKTSVNPNHIELEITETAIMENFSTMMYLLETLHGMGFKLAIDDFGIGYSSLSYLQKFNMDKIKIDKSFIDMIDNTYEDTSLLELIINLGKNLHLVIVAEGIENPSQLQFLKQLNCDEGQGFIFSPAVNPEIYEKHMKKQPFKALVNK